MAMRRDEAWRLGALLLAVLLPAAMSAEGEPGWSGPVDGLRSRLLSDRQVYEANQTVFLHLDVWNVSDKSIKLLRAAWLPAELELIGLDGRNVPAVRETSDYAGEMELPAGRIVSQVSFYTPRLFGLLPPGKYRARWPEVKGKTDARIPPPSDAVEFEVRAAGPAAPAGLGPQVNPAFGKPADGLATCLSARHAKFVAGKPIPMKLMMKNVCSEPRRYHVPQVSANGRVEVKDAKGVPVPFLGGSCQTNNPLVDIAPGETKELDSFDLARLYHLRRPGLYRAWYPGAPPLNAGPAPSPKVLEQNDWRQLLKEPRDWAVPASNSFEFEIVAGPPGPPDPVGRLLPLLRPDWELSAVPSIGRLCKPPGEWSRIPGRWIAFQHHPTAYKRDAVSFSLWLTDEPARPEPWLDDRPAGEYLGLCGPWHAYISIPARALERWPTAKEEIRRALATSP
jgi:hypothetical protein